MLRRGALAAGAHRRALGHHVVGVGADQLRTRQAAGADGERVTTEEYSLGFDAAWELDLFGRLRRAAEAAAAPVVEAAEPGVPRLDEDDEESAI